MSIIPVLFLIAAAVAVAAYFLAPKFKAEVDAEALTLGAVVKSEFETIIDRADSVVADLEAHASRQNNLASIHTTAAEQHAKWAAVATATANTSSTVANGLKAALPPKA